MTDFEDRLRLYTPSGPPPELRAQIVRELAGSSSFRIRDWLPGIATAALIALLYVVATGIRARAYAQIIDSVDIHEIEVPSP
jgi:hypothetical protein